MFIWKMKAASYNSILTNPSIKRFNITVTAVMLCTVFLTALLVDKVFRIQQSSYILHLLILTLVWASLTQTWNLIVGYTGMFTFGHQIFFGVGGYTSALLALHLRLSPWLGMVCGGMVAALLGCLFCVPCLKLRGANIVIATIGMGEIIRLLANNLVEFTRGEAGFWDIKPFNNIFGLNFEGMDKFSYFLLAFVLFILVNYVVVRIVKSPMGLALAAVRGSQEAASSLGVNVTRTKLKAFMAAAFMAGMLGAFYAHYIKILTPKGVLTNSLMINIIAMNILGGLGTIAGPITGSFIVTGLTELLSRLVELRMIIYAILIVLISMFMPAGVAGTIRIKVAKKLGRDARKSNKQPDRPTAVEEKYDGSK